MKKIFSLVFLLTAFLTIMNMGAASAQSLGVYKKALGFEKLTMPLDAQMKIEVLFQEDFPIEKTFFGHMLPLDPQQIKWTLIKSDKEFSQKIAEMTAVKDVIAVNLTDFSLSNQEAALDQFLSAHWMIQKGIHDGYNHLQMIRIGSYDSQETRGSNVDLWIPSKIIFGGYQLYGAKISTLTMTAAFAYLKSQWPQIDRQEILNRLGWKVFNWNSYGFSVNELRFRWTGPGCFQNYGTATSDLPEFMQVQILKGGILVQTTAGGRISFPYDPIVNSTLMRYRRDDMVTASPRGYEIYPRGAMTPSETVEVFQRPYESGPCQIGPVVAGYLFEIR